MARTKSDQTPIQKAAETARAAYSQAKDKLAKADNATNKAAVDHAETRMREAIKNENRERFENIGGGRVAKAIAVIGTLKNVSNRRSYEYTADDVSTAFTAIRAALKASEDAFTNALATTSEKKTSGIAAKFSFPKK